MIAKLLPYTEEDNVSADNIPVYKEPLTLGEEFGRGLGRGTEQVKALGAGLVGMAGAATGLEGVEEWGYNTAQERMQAAAAPELQGDVQSIFDIGSPGDFAHWAAGVMGEQAPNLAISVLGGGVGGALGKRVVSGAVTEALEAQTAKLVAGGLAKNAAMERAKLELAEELGGNITKSLAAEKAAQLAAMKTGVGLGGSATGVGMETSSIYNETRDLGLALKYGVPAGMIEGVADRYFGGKILDAFNPVAEAGQQVAKRSFGKALGAAGAQVGLGAVIEGPLEEVPQTRFEQMARAEKDPNYDINSEGAFRELAEAGAAGMLMGGGMGAAAVGAEYLAPLTMRAKNNLEGLPQGVTPAPLSPEEQRKQEEDELNSIYNFDANTTTIDDGDGDPIEARKFNVGGKVGWAIENPTEEQKRLLPAIPGGRVAITSKSKYGANIQHVLNNGGRVRKTEASITDPSLLDNKIDEEDELSGYTPSSNQNNMLSGDQSGKDDPNLKNELALTEQGLKIATEDSVLAPYRELKNVFNAVDMLDSTEDADQQDSLIRDAVTPEELAAAKQQLATAIAGAKSDDEVTFLGDLEQKISDFEGLQELKRNVAPRKTPVTPFFQKDAEGNLIRTDRELAANVDDRPRKAKREEDALSLWSASVEGRDAAERELSAANALLSSEDKKVKDEDAQEVTPDDFDGLDTYEMMQADLANLETELATQKDPNRIQEIQQKISDLKDAASSLNQDLAPSDLLTRTVNKKIAQAENAPENAEKVSQIQDLEATLSNLKSEKYSLITEEEIENFDNSPDGKKLQALPQQISDLRNSLLKPEEREIAFTEAVAEVKSIREKFLAKKQQDEEAASYLAPQAKDAQDRLDQYKTDVVYTDPETKARVFGRLVADSDTGKATNQTGNFLLLPLNSGGFRDGRVSRGDLADTRMQTGPRVIEITPSQMANVTLDDSAAFSNQISQQAQKAGVDKKTAEVNTPAENITAAAQKINAQREAQEQERESQLEPVDVTKLKVGDRVGFRLQGDGKAAVNIYLSNGMKLVPTSAGIFKGTQVVDGDRQILFDRYYIAKPRSAKDTDHLNSVGLPQLQDGEKLVTLNDISDEDKAAEGIKRNRSKVWQTSENITEGLWGGVYKAPKTMAFASSVVEKGAPVPPLTTPRANTNLTITTGEKFQLEQRVGDLTDTEQVLALMLGGISANPTEEQLIAAGFTPTQEEAEFQVGKKLQLHKVRDVTIDDPVANSGLKLNLKAALFKNSKNPDAPLQVKSFAVFDPKEMLTALRNLQEKEAAKPSQQKAGNVQIARDSLQKAVQNLKRLTLAQMNAGFDVRVPEVNGLPVTQYLDDLGSLVIRELMFGPDKNPAGGLESFGFTASRSGKGIRKYGKGAEAQNFGTFIITGLSISANPDTNEMEHQFTRKVQSVGQSQRQAAMTLRDQTRRGRGFNYQKSGLGVGNLVLENWRAKMLDRAQAAKEREEAAMNKGADLATRHAEALSRLTAFTRPIFQRYVEPIRNHVLGDAKNPRDDSSPEFKDRWLMENELELASILNKFQQAAMPESVAAGLQKQIQTIQANAEKLKPVRFKKRSRKKDSSFGELVDDPRQSEKGFNKLTQDWKQKLARDIADIEDSFYRQLLPRTLQGKKGVTEVNKVLKEIESVKATLRGEVSKIKVKVPAPQQRVNELIDKEAENKNSALGKLNRQLANARTKSAKEGLRKRIEDRKDQIAEQAATQEFLTEEAAEKELLSRIENNGEIAKLNRRLEKLGEFSPQQEALLDKFLDYVEVQAQKSSDETRVALTDRLRTLLGRQKVAAEGGRRIFINVKKEDERLQAQARRNQQRLKKASVPTPATPKAEKKAEQLKKKIEKEIATAKKDLATAEKNLQSNDPAIRQAAQAEKIKAENDIASGEVNLNELLEIVSGAYAESSLLTAEEAYKLMKQDQLLSKEEAYKKAAAKYKSDADTLVEENDQQAASDQEKIDAAVKAMDFAAVTENDRLFEGAATAFTEATQKSKAAYTQAEKNLIQAFGKMMDQVKELNIFGPPRRTADGGSIPNLITRGFSEAKKFQGAIQNSSFRDPETGKTATMDSELMQDILAGKADPTATQMTPEERAKEGKEKLSKEEVRDRRLEDLAALRLRALAEERFGDNTLPPDPNLVELAQVKLFGGSFNDTVNGVKIDRTFEPLAKEYADVLIDFFSQTTARADRANIAQIQEARGRTPVSAQERARLTEASRKVEAVANRILDNYLFDVNPSSLLSKQTALGVTGAPLMSLPSSNSRNQAFDPRVTQSNRDATAAPSRTPAPSWDRAAVQSFVQEYTGLTDSEMVALNDAEIDAINRAATSKADAEMAVNALDAVVAAKPSSETMTAGQLMRAYLDDLQAQQDRGEAEVTLQANLRLAAASKMFESNNAFLEHIASMPRGINRATAMRAKALLALNGKGSWNWNKVATQIASFGIDGKQANWAGVAGKDASNGSGMAIYVNLDATHQGDIVQTMLEEMDHVLTHPLIHAEEFGIQLNKAQSEARDRLRVAYKQAVLKAGEGMQDLVNGAQGMTPEQKVEFYANELLKKASENPEQFRAYYNLTSMDEFVVGVKKDPAFLELMKDLGFNEKTSERSSLSGFIKNIFHALSELITGRKLDPNSELARIFADSWTLSTERDAQQFVVNPTQLSMALGINVASDSGSGIQGAAESVRMKNKSSNAVYNAYLEKAEDGSWSTIVEFGTPPNKLNKKTLLSGATYEEAKKKFDDKIKNKADTYNIIPDKGPDGGGSSTTTPKGPVSPAPQSLSGGSRMSRAVSSVKAVISNIDEAIAKLQIPDLKDSGRYEGMAKSFSSRSLVELGRSADRIREEANLARRDVMRLGSIFNLFSFDDRKIARERFDILERKSRELGEQFLRLQNAELEKEIFTTKLELENAANETIQKFQEAVDTVNLLREATEIINRPDEFTSSPAPQSLPGAPRVSKLLSGKSEGTTYTGQKVTTGGWFSSDANAPQGVDEIYTQSVNRKAFGEEMAQTLAKTLNRALTRYANAGSPVNTDDLNTALGDIENPLNEQQAKEVNRLMLVNEEDAITLKDEYVKANKEDFRRRQQAASARLPKDIAGIVGEMREAIDSLSAYVDEKMGFSVAENLGIYLNRSYLNFGDEAVRELHRKQVRENPVIMDGLKNLLIRQLAEQDANALMKRAAREGKNLSREEAIANAQAALSPTELAAAVERVLTYGDQGVGRIFMSGKIPGQKNLKVLDSRGNIAPEIQAAWGVVKDPATNYVNTVLKLSALVANDQFLNDLKQIGMDSGMIYDPRNPANLSAEDAQRLTDARDAALEADPKLASRARFKPELLDRAMIAQDKVVASILEEAERKIPAGYVKLSGDTNKSLAPLSGMYAQENLAKWMFEKFPAKGEEQLWLSALTKATFIPMAMKTVGSVSGHLRNYYAGYMSLVAGGNFNLFSEDWRRDFAAAHSMTFGRLLNNMDDASKRKAILGARARLGELGLLNQSVAQNFMGDLAKWNTTSSSGIQQGFNAFIGKVGQAYGASDEAFKLMHYFSELGKYRRAFPDMPQAALEEKAARIARDIHQTYGDTYAAVKNLKKVPFIAPFISFTSEVIRNSINLVRLARSEIKEGRATGNKELEAIGQRRVLGMLLAGGGTFAVASAFAAMVGIDGDEERDLRRLLPDWQKNSQLLFLGKSDGKIKFIDFSFTDPNSFLKQPVIAMARELFNDDDRAFNERLMAGVVESVKSLVEPFVSPQLFTGALVELSANRNASGRQIYNPQDNPASIAADMTWHLGKLFVPGTLDSAGRVGNAITGFVSESGRSYELWNEITSFGGVRVSETDVRQSIGFKAKQFMRDYRDAASLFTSPFLSRGTQSESDIMGGYQKANESIRGLSEKFREIYTGAMRLGVPQREVISILKANGISDDAIKMLRTGIIPPYQASKQALTKNREAKQDERNRAYNQAYAEAKKY